MLYGLGDLTGLKRHCLVLGPCGFTGSLFFVIGSVTTMQRIVQNWTETVLFAVP